MFICWTNWVPWDDAIVMSADKLRKLWDSVSELRSSVCERRLERTVLRPELLPAKLHSLLSFFPSFMTSHSKIAQFNWECKAPFKLFQPITVLTNLLFLSARAQIAVNFRRNSFSRVENLSVLAPYFRLFQWRHSVPDRLAPRATARLARILHLIPPSGHNLWYFPSNINGTGAPQLLKFSDNMSIVKVTLPTTPCDT